MSFDGSRSGARRQVTFKRLPKNACFVLPDRPTGIVYKKTAATKAETARWGEAQVAPVRKSFKPSTPVRLRSCPLNYFQHLDLEHPGRVGRLFPQLMARKVNK